MPGANISDIRCPLCCNQKLYLFSQQRSGVPWHLYSLQSGLPETLDFFKCDECKLVTKDPAVRCNSLQERKHYEKHNNNLEDHGYRQHLLRLVTPIVQLVNSKGIGLDYGCGPIISIGELLKEHAIRCDSYDPIFFPNEDLLERGAYNFVTCCEVVEHFKNPAEEFDRLFNLLTSGGLLLISTHLIPRSFEDWWYQRDPTHIVFYSIDTFSWIAKKYQVNFKELGENLFLFSKE